MSGILNHPPSKVIRQLLINLGLCSNGATWPVYATNHPETPDDSVAVFDVTGTTQGRVHDTGETQDFYGIQVRIRSASQDAGYTKARAIMDAFDLQVGLDSVTVDTDDYMVYAITRSSDLLSLGYESPTSRRKLFTLNVKVSLRMLTSLGS